MIARFKIWLTELSTFTKMVWVFVPVILGVAKLITVHDSNILARSKAQQEQISDKALLKDISESIKIINENQVTISSQVGNVSEQVNVLGRKFETQSKAIGNHFQKENMLQDKINFLQELIDDEKKNNGLSGLLIQSSGVINQ
jgi:hypothetical protein